MKLRFFAVCILLGIATNATAEWNKGLEAYKRKDWATAVKEFEEVTRTNPNYAGAYYMMGVSQRALGQLSPALASLRKAVALDGGQVSYKVALGQALVQVKQYQDAYSVLKPLDINSMDGNFRSSYALLFAQATTKTNRPEEAIRVLNTQIRADGSNPRLQQALGVAYNATGDDAKAFAAFKKAFDINPKDEASGRSATYAAIAVARRSRSSSEKARYYTQAAQTAERLVAADSTFEHHLLAGEAWLGAKNYSKALSWFETAKAQQPRNPLVRFYLAQCHTDQGDLDAALAELDEANELGASGKLSEQIQNQQNLILGEKGPLVECAGFRDTTWGMSQSQVIAIEGTPEHTEKNTLGYPGEVAGESAFIFYGFVNDQLSTGRYLFAEDHVFKNEYIDDYNKFKDLLTKKYGRPRIDKIAWKNDLYKNDPQEWGIAVSIGHLVFLANWETDKTDIGLVLRGDNFDVSLGILYSSRDLADEAEKADSESDLSDL